MVGPLVPGSTVGETLRLRTTVGLTHDKPFLEWESVVVVAALSGVVVEGDVPHTVHPRPLAPDLDSSTTHQRDTLDPVLPDSKEVSLFS